jgi:MYXO-CTERM domain-containing protein
MPDAAVTPDGGVADGGIADGGGAHGGDADAGAMDAGSGVTTGGGCGCRTSRAGGSGGWALATLLAVCVARRRATSRSSGRARPSV